jgi:hypothetical protein
MFLVAFILLAIPGLIAARIHWSGREPMPANWFVFLCDYFTYTFFILFLDYAFLFITYTKRIVSFSTEISGSNASTIFNASFVFKYALTSLILALVLPRVWNAVKHRKNNPKLRALDEDDD